MRKMILNCCLTMNSRRNYCWKMIVRSWNLNFGNCSMMRIANWMSWRIVNWRNLRIQNLNY